jgi:hypothetical protein
VAEVGRAGAAGLHDDFQGDPMRLIPVRRLLSTVLILALAVFGVETAAASSEVNQPYGHNAPYGGSNNYPAGTTPGVGDYRGLSGQQWGGYTNWYNADASYFQWNQTAVDWIRANASGFWGSNEFQVAVVFHAFQPNSQTCASVAAYSAYSNLTGSYYHVKSTCSNWNNEIRFYAGDPSQLTTQGFDNNGYDDQAWFYDFSNTCNEIDVNNYHEDTQFGNGVNKDNMGKFYYNNQDILAPNADGSRPC